MIEHHNRQIFSVGERRKAGRRLADGTTNRESADELVLTVNTVKRHISNIFGKLEVSNRTQAIARARQLNLL